MMKINQWTSLMSNKYLYKDKYEMLYQNILEMKYEKQGEN